MTDLQTLLERAVDDPGAGDPAAELGADLRRGRSALRRRHRVAGAGVAVAVLALGGTAGIVRSSQDSRAVHPATQGGEQASVRAGSFEIPPPPDGWAVQAADESLVVIAPEGLPRVDLHSPALNFALAGKIVIEYLDQSEPLREGRPIRYDGRSFYWLRSAGYPRGVSVETSSGNWLRLQEASKLHWTLHQLIEYLDGVQPLRGAVARDS